MYIPQTGADFRRHLRGSYSFSLWVAFEEHTKAVPDFSCAAAGLPPDAAGGVLAQFAVNLRTICLGSCLPACLHACLPACMLVDCR